MFTTVESTKELTGKDVSQETVIMAQSIVEAYIGKIEIEVTDPTDRALLDKATAYQAAYMHGDEAKVFEQMATIQVMQSGNMVTFDTNSDSPWIAPLAVIVCRRLSWKRIHSIRVGPLFPRGPVNGKRGWFYE